jgi:hypothetical protein
MIMTCRLRLFVAHAVAACSIALAQTTPSAEPFVESIQPEGSPSLSSAGNVPSGCNPWKLNTFSTDLSFGERACIGLSDLASPGLALQIGVMSGVAQWRNNTHLNKNDNDDIGTRIAHAYERHAARVTAETLVGYLHHEDPRLHASGEQGGWRRTRAAFLSVLESPDQDGKARMAFAPLAGSFGSGLTSMALQSRQNSLGYGLERSGLVYSHYFVRALAREFSPEIWSLAPRFVKKFHKDDGAAN